MFQDLVRQARSHRRFDERQPVTVHELRAMVDLARLAPCGGNKQALRYRLVSERGECAAIFPFIAWAAALKPWPGPAEGERPTGYVAILAAGESGTDVGIAAATLQFAATAMGYRACMLGAIRRPDLKAALRIPDPYGVQLLVAIGRPGETVVIDEVRAGADLKYYRDAAGIHHVPKLALDDVLIAP